MPTCPVNRSHDSIIFYASEEHKRPLQALSGMDGHERHTFGRIKLIIDEGGKARIVQERSEALVITVPLVVSHH